MNAHPERSESFPKDPLSLLRTALGKRVEEIPFRTAISSASKEVGKNFLLAAQTTVGASEISWELRDKTAIAAGLIVVGNIAQNIEYARVHGWDDDMYLSTFNAAVRELRFLEQFVAPTPVSPSIEETIRLRKIAQEDDGTLLTFFQNDKNLPMVIQRHLEQLPPRIRMYGYSEAIRRFIDTNKQLEQLDYYDKIISDFDNDKKAQEFMRRKESPKESGLPLSKKVAS